MKHASRASLDALAPLLASLDCLPELTQKSPGIYYRKRAAFLHFHEDAAGMFADLKVEGDWRRFPANSKTERSRLLRVVATTIAAAPRLRSG